MTPLDLNHQLQANCWKQDQRGAATDSRTHRKLVALEAETGPEPGFLIPT